MIYNIYKITNTITGKVYIGQTRRDITKRFNDHKYRIKSNRQADKNCKIYQDMLTHGSDVYIIDLLEQIDGDRFDANNREIYWISKYDSTNPYFGLNTDPGGVCIYSNCRNAGITATIARNNTTTDADKAKLADIGRRNSKPVMRVDNNTLAVVIYESIIGASRETGIDRRTIQRYLSGIYSTKKAKFTWTYINCVAS
jgi:group I intron endonuclease